MHSLTLSTFFIFEIVILGIGTNQITAAVFKTRHSIQPTGKVENELLYCIKKQVTASFVALYL